MKKIVIPAILAATILVAGMFAFMPVQKASTVHTTINAEVKDLCKAVFTNGAFLGGTNRTAADAAIICTGVG